MITVNFLTTNGELKTVQTDAPTLMEAAVQNGIERIDADCGGVCSCATCHVSVATEWMDRVGPANEIESVMLDLEDTASSHSRLSCQVNLGPELNGLKVTVVDRG